MAISRPSHHLSDHCSLSLLCLISATCFLLQKRNDHDPVVVRVRDDEAPAPASSKISSKISLFSGKMAISGPRTVSS